MAGWGSGGEPNFLPGRGYPIFGSDVNRDMPDDWVGGARGVVATQARVIEGGAPAPSQRLEGAHGTVSFHRGSFVEDAGAPRLDYDNVLGHGDIPWSRPTYNNVAGKLGYNPPTQMPSWSADSAVVPGLPSVPVPYSKKHIGSFTVRHQYGSTREIFYNGSLAPFVAGLPSGMDQQGRRGRAQSKTRSPVLYNRAKYGTAGSYGQTTRTLPTAPSNVVASNSPYGPY